MLQKGPHSCSLQSCEILGILDKCRSQWALNYFCSCSPDFAVMQGMLRSTAPKHRLESHCSLIGLMLSPSQKPQWEWGTICWCLFWLMEGVNPVERKLLQEICHFYLLLTHFPAKLEGLCPWETLQAHGKGSGKSNPQTFHCSHRKELKEQKNQGREDERASWFWTGFFRVKKSAETFSCSETMQKLNSSRVFAAVNCYPEPQCFWLPGLYLSCVSFPSIFRVIFRFMAWHKQIANPSIVPLTTCFLSNILSCRITESAGMTLM